MIEILLGVLFFLLLLDRYLSRVKLDECQLIIEEQQEEKNKLKRRVHRQVLTILMVQECLNIALKNKDIDSSKAEEYTERACRELIASMGNSDRSFEVTMERWENFIELTRDDGFA